MTVNQVPNGPGKLIDVIPRDDADQRPLVISVAGKVIRHAHPRPAARRSRS